MASQSTSDYYKTHPGARKIRLAQQSAYQKTPKGRSIKKAANKLNRKLGTYGNGDGLDASHYKGSKTKGRLLPQSKNRASRLKIRRHA